MAVIGLPVAKFPGAASRARSSSSMTLHPGRQIMSAKEAASKDRDPDPLRSGPPHSAENSPTSRSRKLALSAYPRLKWSSASGAWLSGAFSAPGTKCSP